MSQPLAHVSLLSEMLRQTRQALRVSLHGPSDYKRAQYVVVQNATSPQSDFSYWDSAEQAIRFREALVENPARQHSIRLGQVAARQNAIDELKRASIVMRAGNYRRRLFSEFDRSKEMFLP